VILYLDTSALVKLYVREEASDDVRACVARAEAVSTSQVAYPEARAAFARRQREGAFDTDDLRRIVDALDRDLAALVVVNLDRPLARRAGQLAERHALRGFDAIHLASAVELWELMGAVPTFLAYDSRLMNAARAEGIDAPS
jgi:predicted nucleic acid-binding protein